MKKTKKEQSDLDIDLEHDPYMANFNKLTLLKTKAIFKSKMGDKFEIQRRSRGYLCITFFSPKTIGYTKCNMGHEHKITEDEKWIFGGLHEEHVEQLIEWMQDGVWKTKNHK